MTTHTLKTDVILPMQEPYMQQIVDGLKNHEFCKYLITPTVERIWFYRIAPHSSIEYVCECEPARTRNPEDLPLPEDGLGNKDFNEHDPSYEGYDYAYKILSVYRLGEAVTLEKLKEEHEFKSAPRGMRYVPVTLDAKVGWTKEKIW
ncbi:MAG: hypothetical protein M1831_006532 [Alyxoria varia]|nr:MAG: hypothetical protein M1831_006532 [Alyxoria varia]